MVKKQSVYSTLKLQFLLIRYSLQWFSYWCVNRKVVCCKPEGRVAAVHDNQMSRNLQASWMAAADCYLKAKDGGWATFYTQFLILYRQTFLITAATEAWELTTPNIPDLHLSVLRILLMML